jgi:hypothetical protein
MIENKLRVGEPRLCRLVDGNPNTPEAVVMLQDTGDAIETTFPLSGMAEPDDGPYDRWWSQGAYYGDDPDREKYSYAPPSTMLLYDSGGCVVLVGCHAARRISGPAAGTGVVVSDFAVLGTENLKYDLINGMRTESRAFLRWVKKSATRIIEGADESGRVQSARADAESIRVSQKLNMTMRRLRRSTPVPGGHDVREPLAFQSLAQDPRHWNEHLQLHVAVLNLVSIAAWKNCAFRALYVNRVDDPNMGVERWAEVVTHVLPGDDMTDCDGHFLFTYGDMAEGAIDEWFRLYEIYGRALSYLIRILRSGYTWSTSSAVMSGIALEQLGYLIEVENGRNKQISFNHALDVVLDDMYMVPLESKEDWKECCNKVYMGAKHGNRPEPDHLMTLNILRENLLVLRYWIAQRLGVPGDVLNQNLMRDPLARKWKYS